MAEAGKTYLRQTNEQGASVYSHLTDVLATLLDQKPSDALGMLEGISLSCKASTYAPSKVADAPPELPAEPAPAGWAEASSTLLAAAKAPEEGTDQGSITDVLMESKLFEQCAARPHHGASPRARRARRARLRRVAPPSRAPHAPHALTRGGARALPLAAPAWASRRRRRTACTPRSCSCSSRRT